MSMQWRGAMDTSPVPFQLTLPPTGVAILIDHVLEAAIVPVMVNHHACRVTSARYRHGGTDI